MRYGSVCSGIEAATVAWHPLGFEPVFFSEIEPFPCAVLAHHYPHVPNHGDMTQFERWPGHAIDLLVGGTPCQDYSVAGLRLGMAGDRGQLTLVFVEILGRYRPAWFLWENVPGVLSSNGGQDFGRFLGELTGTAIEPPAGGWQNAGIVTGGPDSYGIAWRVLDAQFARTCLFPFAVPQRRRRVFVVGYLGDWRAAAAVLFDAESLQGNPAPGRKARKGLAADVAPGLVGSGRGVERAGETRGQDPVVAVAEVCGALNNSGGNAYPGQTLQDATIGQLLAFGGNNRSGDIDVAAALLSHSESGVRLDFESDTFVAHSLRADGFDASEDGSGRGTPLVPVAFDCKGTEVQAVADGSHPTLRSMGHDGSHQNAGGHAVVAIQERAVSENPDAGPDGAGFRADGAAYTLEARQVPQAVADAWQVRRLMPVECERLQGFADGHTRVPGASAGGWRDLDDGEDLEELKALGLPVRLKGNQWRVKDPDGPRYKALGNSMAVNVMHWLGERIALVDALIREAAL